MRSASSTAVTETTEFTGTIINRRTAPLIAASTVVKETLAQQQLSCQPFCR